MKSLAELQAIRDKVKKQIDIREEKGDSTRILVGMATCGIAAGARSVLNEFVDEIAKRGLNNVTVTQTGCIGICQYEPVVEVIVPGQEKVTYVKMTPEQKLAYKNCMKDVKLKLKQGEEDKIAIFSYLTRLRQICLDPSLVNKEYKGKSGKFMVATDVINDVITNGYKILVFSQFTSVLKKLNEELISKKIKSKYLDGSITAKERLKLVEEFNEKIQPQVFLISLKAGGTGLNLTSAKFVMHMDPWWNPAIEDQATDRAHRIGQKDIVEVIKLIAKDTIEENIIKLQEDKREIVNSVISDESLNINNISKLTNEEILDLFK